MNTISNTALMMALATGLAACSGGSEDQLNQPEAANVTATSHIENVAEADNAIAALPTSSAAKPSGENASRQAEAEPAPVEKPKAATKAEPKSTSENARSAPKAAPAPPPEGEPKAPPAPATCTPEHRALGHC